MEAEYATGVGRTRSMAAVWWARGLGLICWSLGVFLGGEQPADAGGSGDWIQQITSRRCGYEPGAQGAGEACGLPSRLDPAVAWPVPSRFRVLDLPSGQRCWSAARRGRGALRLR